MRDLTAKVKNDMTALLEENEPLRKQRQKRQEKERREREEREEKRQESLMQIHLNELAWAFPCRRDQAKKILDRLVCYDVPVGWLLLIAEDLEWEDNTSGLKPLITECANLLKGNRKETERIMGIVCTRKKRILIPSDKDMEEKYLHMLNLLTREEKDRSVEMVFKFNAALSRLAEERFIDTEELLSKETLEPVVG